MDENNKMNASIGDVTDNSVDFDSLEAQLESELEEKMSEFQFLESERKQIGNPDALGETIKNVVWEQFLNQIAVTAGEDFIKENRGLTLDLRTEAHIQTPENFVNGNIATHNYISKEQLKQNYDRYKNTPHKQFRKRYVNPGMNVALKRAGELKKEGINTVTDIYTGRQISTETKLENGKINPKGAEREHVIPSEKLYKNPSLQMANSNKELADIINNPEILQGYTTRERNNRKLNKLSDEMSECDKNKHWEKANKRAEEFTNQKEKEGEDRLKKEGNITQKEEKEKAFCMGKKALKRFFMQLLAELVKEIIGKLVKWFKDRKKNFNSLIDSIKTAIKSFVGKLMKHIITAGNTFVTTIATAIVGPVVETIKKVWMMLKQGWKSLKDAIVFLKNPANRDIPMSVKVLEVGKIVMAGLSGIGALVLGEVIEKGLMSVPAFTVEIPFLGSLANIIGIFMGAVVAGIIGAIVINLLDNATAKKRRELSTENQVDKGNEILKTQRELREITVAKTEETINNTAETIKTRHTEVGEIIRESVSEIYSGEAKDHKIDFDEIDSALDGLLDS